MPKIASAAQIDERLKLLGRTQAIDALRARLQALPLRGVETFGPRDALPATRLAQGSPGRQFRTIKVDDAVWVVRIRSAVKETQP